MKMYYISGLPYSENELYHHGIPNQKWGVRNYQNPDGSLTDLGRQHYGVGPARERKNGLGRRFITYQINKIKARHPWMFTDEELDTAINRARNEYAFRKTRDDFKQLNHASTRAKKVVGDILESSAKNLTSRAVNKIGDKIFDNDKMKHVTMSQILANPSAYTKKDFDIAKALFEGKRAYELHEINRREKVRKLLRDEQEEDAPKPDKPDAPKPDKKDKPSSSDTSDREDDGLVDQPLLPKSLRQRGADPNDGNGSSRSELTKGLGDMSDWDVVGYNGPAFQKSLNGNTYTQYTPSDKQKTNLYTGRITDGPTGYEDSTKTDKAMIWLWSQSSEPIPVANTVNGTTWTDPYGNKLSSAGENYVKEYLKQQKQYDGNNI